MAVNIQNIEGGRYISAYEMYKALQVTKRFSSWWKNTLQGGFELTEDYWRTETRIQDGDSVKSIKDYLLTLPAAKEVATMQKTEQGRELRKYISCVSLNSGIDEEIDRVESVFAEAYEGYMFFPKFRLTVKRFIKNLGVDAVVDYMEQSVTAKYNNADHALKYFCGICWNKIKGE